MKTVTLELTDAEKEFLLVLLQEDRREIVNETRRHDAEKSEADAEVDDWLIDLITNIIRKLGDEPGDMSKHTILK